MSRDPLTRCADTATHRADKGSTIPQRFWLDYPCPHPAKFMVIPRTGYGPQKAVCGVHARTYRSDFGVEVESL